MAERKCEVCGADLPPDLMEGLCPRCFLQQVMAETGDGSGNMRREGTFPTTQWGLVHAASQAGTPQAENALAKLCQIYWYPLYAFVRRQGYSPQDAQDLTHAFFVHLLEKNVLAGAEKGRSRFRSFLLTAMRNFQINEWRGGQVRKPEGGHVHLSLVADTAETPHAAEPPDDASPEKVWNRNWAWALLDRVLKRLRANEAANGNGALFDRLKPALMGERFPPFYTGMAAAFGTTEEALRMAGHRLRRQFRKLLREEIAPMVGSPEEIDGFIRRLLAVLGS